MSKWYQRIKAQKPSEDLSEFKGKTLTMMTGETVKVESIVGSKIKQARFEVNGQYHIVILDAYKQLNNDKSITQEMIDKFDQMTCEVERIEAPDPLKPQPIPKYGA